MITAAQINKEMFVLKKIQQVIKIVFAVFVICTFIFVYSLTGIVNTNLTLHYLISYIFLSMTGILLFIVFTYFRLKKKYNGNYISHVKTTYFSSHTIDRKPFLSLLGMKEENLHFYGFNYLVKEFTFDNFLYMQKKLSSKKTGFRRRRSIMRLETLNLTKTPGGVEK